MILFDEEEFGEFWEGMVPHGFVTICNGCGFKSYRKNHLRYQNINRKCNKCGCDLTFGKATSWISDGKT